MINLSNKVTLRIVSSKPEKYLDTRVSGYSYVLMSDIEAFDSHRGFNW